MSATTRTGRTRGRNRRPRQTRTTRVGGLVTGPRLTILILMITVLAVGVASTLTSVPVTP